MRLQHVIWSFKILEFQSIQRGLSSNTISEFSKYFLVLVRRTARWIQVSQVDWANWRLENRKVEINVFRITPFLNRSYWTRRVPFCLRLNSKDQSWFVTLSEVRVARGKLPFSLTRSCDLLSFRTALDKASHFENYMTRLPFLPLLAFSIPSFSAAILLVGEKLHSHFGWF